MTTLRRTTSTSSAQTSAEPAGSAPRRPASRSPARATSSAAVVDAIEPASVRPATMTNAQPTRADSKASVAATTDAAPVKGSRLLDVAVQPRRLPSLRQALRSDRIAAVPPAKLFEAPAALIDALDRGKKVLVIGHTPPDGDCVGSALGLARMLRALGREAHVCIDDVIPGNLRKLADDPSELKRANELHDDYDLVVIVDVAAVDRIGGAAAAVARAPAVAVIDHHQVDASREDLALDANTPLTTWVMPHVDSASLLVASAIDALSSGTRASSSTTRRARRSTCPSPRGPSRTPTASRDPAPRWPRSRATNTWSSRT
jgi:hypothetical protein